MKHHVSTLFVKYFKTAWNTFAVFKMLYLYFLFLVPIQILIRNTIFVSVQIYLFQRRLKIFLISLNIIVAE